MNSVIIALIISSPALLGILIFSIVCAYLNYKDRKKSGKKPNYSIMDDWPL